MDQHRSGGYPQRNGRLRRQQSTRPGQTSMGRSGGQRTPGGRRAVVLGGLGVSGVPRAYKRRNKNTAPLDDATLMAKALGTEVEELGQSPRMARPEHARNARPMIPGRGNQRGRGPRTRGGRSGDVIDVSRFVNKNVEVREEIVYTPTHQFGDFAVDERLKTNIAKKGYVVPTAIQDQTIPHCLKGRDVIGLANTGEGKTAAFLIPLIDKLLRNSEERLLVVAPTRELALQIDEEFMAFAAGLRIFSVLAIGGVGMGAQIERIRRTNCRVVIGTPGRLRDLIDRKVLLLGTTHNLVLDEADRMLDMGFIPDIRYLLEHLPEKRQNLFFSATFPSDVEKLASAMLHDPIRVSVKKRETSSNIEQDVVRTSGDRAEKFRVLSELLQRPEFAKVLIFGRTKWGVEKLGRALYQEGLPAVAIHGDKSQGQRQAALRDFKSGKARILVATDVAARGLDIPSVSHVINYEVPATYEDYVHRIGRTGRAGKKGVALTFVE